MSSLLILKSSLHSILASIKKSFLILFLLQKEFYLADAFIVHAVFNIKAGI